MCAAIASLGGVVEVVETLIPGWVRIGQRSVGNSPKGVVRPLMPSIR